MDKDVISGYVEDHDHLIRAFESVDSSLLLSQVAEFLPNSPSHVADIGAGTGRDAGWLASKGHRVLAVEPVDEFRLAGSSLHPSDRIKWLKDSLPFLNKIIQGNEKFDVVLLSAVWQHVKTEDRELALASLRTTLKTGGKMAISLRNGAGAPNRRCYPIIVEDMLSLLGRCRFKLLCRREAASAQKGNQMAGVTWTWLVVEAVG